MDKNKNSRLNNYDLQQRYSNNQNQDDFVLIELENDGNIKFKATFGHLGCSDDEKRKNSMISVDFSEKFNNLMFLKQYDPNTSELHYVPGTLSRDLKFIEHPIQAGNIVIHSIIEKTNTNVFESLVEISLININEKKDYETNGENIFVRNKKISVSTGYKSTLYDLNIFFNTLNKFIEAGFDINKLASDIKISYAEPYIEIFDFFDKIILKKYISGYNTGRKGGRWTEGYIIDNLPKNVKHLIALLIEHTRFKYNNGKLKGYEKSESEYPYIRGTDGDYQEIELLGNEQNFEEKNFKNKLIYLLTKNYNPETRLIYQLFAQNEHPF